MEKHQRNFRTRARLLQHLGDQLISSPRLAVFELVKNAYDADASTVNIELEDIGKENPRIVVTDNGLGMNLATVENIWLVIAHDHKEKAVQKLARTKMGRLPLGSKGLGRLSVHKLGNEIEMVTRHADDDEIVVRINWNDLIANEFLEEASIEVTRRPPNIFKGNKTGTKITISDLRQKQWTRGEVRRLYRQVTSISSPFGGPERKDFVANLTIPGLMQWLEKVPNPKDLLKKAPWKFSFQFDGKTFGYEYEFRKISGLAVDGRVKKERDATLLIPPGDADEDDDPLFSGKAKPGSKAKIVADEAMLEGIGVISGEIHVFDLSSEITQKMGEPQLVKSFLSESGGVRVYRDGVRVYDYGEKDNDWLGMDLRRVNDPTKGLSRNIVVGHVEISQETSFELVEKSNREGFIENSALDRFRRIVIGILAHLQYERELDREQIRKLLGKAHDPETKGILEPVDKIRKIAVRKDIFAQVNPLLERIEHEYKALKERLAKVSVSGTSLAVVFHELEQGIRSLYQNIEANDVQSGVAEQARELMLLLDGFSDLMRSNQRKQTDLKLLVQRVRDLNLVRFRHHKISLTCDPLDESFPTVHANVSFGLTMGALTNLIDNAIYWMRVRRPEDENGNAPEGRELFISIEEDFDGAPAIIVADNGTGFQDSAGDMVRPFYSRRPEGMGMGLYYANLVMELNDGELVFPDTTAVDVPDRFDGAVVALRFLK